MCLQSVMQEVCTCITSSLLLCRGREEEEEVESSKNVKKTWSGLLQVGRSRCRRCAPICTYNRHLSEMQQMKPLKVVRDVCAIGLLPCRAAWQGGGGRVAVLTVMLFCELLGGVPEGRLVGVQRRGQLTWALCVKQDETSSALRLTRPPEILFISPPRFLSLSCSFSVKELLVGGDLTFLNSGSSNFLTVNSPASHRLAIAKGFNVLYYSDYAVLKTVFILLFARLLPALSR